MEALLQSLLADSHGLAAYLTVFGILVACGLGVPLPEDISLILGGYLAYQGAAALPVMFVVGFLGIIVGDSLIYLVGRRVGESPSSGWLGRIVTPEKREIVARMFEKHGRKVVMIARFMPGVRAVTYFTAGSVKMNYFQFIFWDGLAALVSAPLFIYLGYRFGDEMDLLVSKVKEGQFAVLAVIVVIAAGAWLYHRRRKARVLAAASIDEAETAAEDALAPQQDPRAIPAPRPQNVVAVTAPEPVSLDEVGLRPMLGSASASRVEVPEPAAVAGGESELRPGS